MFKTITIIFAIISLLKLQNIHAQDLVYSIFRGDDKIGHIKVKKTSSGQEEKISILSEATFKVLWSTHHRSSDFEVVFKNDVLHYSLMETILNDEVDKKTETKKQNDQYLCIEHPDEKHFIDENITFSSAQLYYREPVNIKKVYSESYLQLCPLEKQENGSYKLSLPGGKDNYYTYKNGTLDEVLVDRTWFDITFRRED